MAWAFVAHRGSAQNKTASTTLTVNPTANLAVDSIIVVRVAWEDPIDTGSAIADDKGNTWTRLVTEGSDNVTRGTAWISKIDTQILTTDAITITFDVNVTAKVVGLEEFSVAAGQTFSIVGESARAAGTSTTPSVTLSGLASATHLFLGILAVRGPNGDTFTQDVDYANNTSIGTTGASANSNRYSRFGSRIVSATSDTYAPTLGNSRSWNAWLVAVDEVSEGTTFNQTLNATAPATAAFGGKTTNKLVNSTAPAVSQFGAFTTNKLLNSTAAANAAILKTSFVTLLGEAIAVATLQASSIFFETVTATAAAAASVVGQFVALETLNATAPATAQFGSFTIMKLLNAQAPASAQMVRDISVTLLAQALAQATVLHAAAFNLTLQASAVAIAQQLMSSTHSEAAVATATATINTTFIPGGGGGGLVRIWVWVLRHLVFGREF